MEFNMKKMHNAQPLIMQTSFYVNQDDWEVYVCVSRVDG